MFPDDPKKQWAAAGAAALVALTAGFLILSSGSKPTDEVFTNQTSGPPQNLRPVSGIIVPVEEPEEVIDLAPRE